MPEVIIGVGTNLGDRLAHLRRGVRGLRGRAPEFRVRSISPVYESDALVPEGAPEAWRRPYLNLAVRAEWDDGPEVLLRSLKSLETMLGRGPRARWEPREVDLDLLAFGDLVVVTSELTLPHPGLANRPFALLPFADVAPTWRFPPGASDLAGQTAQEAASRWRGPPDRVPFNARRTPLSLTEIVAVLNLTPDSFSDAGRYLDPVRAAEHALAMVDAGATVVDLGAESTRPGAATVPLDPEEEWRRLEPVLSRLVAGPRAGGGSRALLSVDTRHPETAERAIAAGANWINDVTSLRDPAMLDVVVPRAVDLVLMHSVTVPPAPDQTIPTDGDPVKFLLGWGAGRLAELAAHGVERARLILDPGIGFGKTPDQSVEILRRADALATLSARVLVGHSRKSFLAGWFPPDHPAAQNPAARDFESALIAGHLAGLAVDYVRVHDVEHASRALRAVSSLAGPRHCTGP